MRRHGGRAIAALGCAVVTIAGCGSSPSTPPSTSHASDAVGTSTAAARHFLDDYVSADGRVIRHDQGGDIVSEGQAYGMLVAEIAGRPGTVRAIWAWTRAHLSRADGLLQSQADGAGSIENPQPAADADVLAAYALLRYRGAGAGALHRAGRALAGAVLGHESVSTGSAVVIAAGPWALASRPVTVDPSYLMPGVFAALARDTGDARWARAAATAVRLVRGLTEDGRLLPADWATLDAGHLTAVPKPGGGVPVQYGLDAQRLPLWFATACTAPARDLAGRWWTDVLAHGDRAAKLALTPRGATVTGTTNPLPLLAAAAAAHAAGDGSAAASLLGRARAQARATPTYYGDAWLALASSLLDGALGPCREAAAGAPSGT
ncbi:MAG: glycoside hydrolase [Jatrophihabitans sp.]|nr:MAG: glycoside hydrolase [Jatrophihabitans sp.]